MLESFSYAIKKELSEINNLARKDEVKYELLGYLSSDNTAVEKTKIRYSTESQYNINRFAKLLRNVDINSFDIEIQGKIYIITLKVKDIENISFDNDLDELSEENIKAYIRGIFLGAGSINNPNNKYHLEIKLLENENNIARALKKHDINVKTMDKSIYIKDGEEISKFLAFIGATKSMLEFEQIRVQRDMNNKINRLVNCKTANLTKTINASIEQVNAIKKLKETGKFNKMDINLKELAECRLENPDMPLSELGKLLSKPIGKSGVNYRMKKIIELSKD